MAKGTASLGQRQRRGLIPAWGQGPRFRNAKTPQGLKARGSQQRTTITPPAFNVIGYAPFWRSAGVAQVSKTCRIADFQIGRALSTTEARRHRERKK